MFLAVLLTSCSNPAKEKLQHLQRGDQIAAQKRDEFAVVEYAAAVQLDPKFGPALSKLAQTYERMDNPRAAYPTFVPPTRADDPRRPVEVDARVIADGAFR